MQRAVSVIFLYAVFWIAVATNLELPRWIKRCHSNASDYESCMKGAVQDAIPRLARDGIPSLNFPALDPYFCDREDDDYSMGPLRAKSEIRNTTVYGVAKTEVLSVTTLSQENSFYLKINVAIPKIFMEGFYKLNGSILGMKIGGGGKYNISMTGLTTAWVLTGPVNNDKWTVEHFTMLPKVTTMKVYFDDLFNGNKILNKIAYSVVNDYWKVFYDLMLPTVAKSWDTELSEVANKIFSKVSFSKTFP